MRDRRQDDRVQIGKECMLYIKGKDEIPCIVKDISEVGIAFEMEYSETLYKQLKEIKEIKFSYLDEFIFIGTEQTTIITAVCNIVRVVKKKEKLLIGCKMNSNSNIKHYVVQKKVNAFMESINSHKTQYREG